MSSSRSHRNGVVGRAIEIAGAAIACAAIACEPELRVGARRVAEAACDLGEGGATASEEKVVPVPWSTGFEDGFCDYTRAGGFCYARPDASNGIVDVPAHGGASAAAFSVTSAAGTDGEHTRCFLEGALPVDAVYGAWFYVPALAGNTSNWNLFHYRTGVPPVLEGRWDVSLGSAEDGSLYLYVLDFARGPLIPEPAPAVPIGSWFHVEFRLRRAAGDTGEVALYQDGVLLAQRTAIATDPANFGQWYVGNLADALTPSESTVFVDDVSIRAP